MSDEEIDTRAVFYVGQEVELTADGAYSGACDRPTGVVRGFGKRANRIRVQPDGLKGTYTYHASFWRPRSTRRDSHRLA